MATAVRRHRPPFVAHLSEVEQVADSAAILRSGRVVRVARIAELRASARPRSV